MKVTLKYFEFFIPRLEETPTTTEMPVNQTIDSATIMRYNLNVGAANVDYGAFAYHRKYIPVTILPTIHPQEED